MKPRIPLPLTVTESQIISPSIRRITLHGESIAHFEHDVAGRYFKFLFTPAGTTDLTELSDEARPVMRTYTIRKYDANSHKIEVDFVRHQIEDLGCGFAARWAESAKPGDMISIVGPGQSTYPSFEHDWVFFVADMTALPAMSVTLERLADSARGYAVIEIETQADIQTLHHPENVEVIWAIRDQQQSLEETVKSIIWLDGQADVWCACEFETMRSLRHYFRNERGIEKEHLYISSYWKDGISEDGHKILKRQDMEK
ncbi:siderophore-interacting protein [Vibrio mangrovi]|uniref:Siderophore-interacting protein n=1 Tax=Vibrio mangrovi TaxID=474394 RepID=A0A1Y6IV64_9VIBR|nr:siderophore-interacting protein [Vibrio mangrovi]MDW6005540.1 siderophore-interacting protein [Vibrio mangrovi]SMS00710.1 Vibriobactin utilization protein ViuB [Vibrio mangrovi]